MKESLKKYGQPLSEMANKTIIDESAYARYCKINENYNLLISSLY